MIIINLFIRPVLKPVETDAEVKFRYVVNLSNQDLLIKETSILRTSSLIRTSI